MEAILVFDFNNYLIYDKYNKIFLDNFADIAKTNKLVDNHLESKSKIIHLLQHNDEEFNNLITLIFGPYVASIRLLRENCPEVDLFEQKQIKILTRSYLDYMFLLVCEKSNERTLIELNRKLEIFVDLTKLFYGVSISELENDSTNERSLLEYNLRCWEQSKDQLLFKLNAIERITINEQIKNDLERMLLYLIDQINEEPLLKEIPFQSMVFINDMLICDYKRPNSPKILHSDLILLTLMVKTYFYCVSDLKDQTLISSDSDYIASDDEDFEFYDNYDLGNSKNNGNLINRNLLEDNLKYLMRLNDELNKSNHTGRSIISRITESDKYLFDDCDHQLIFLHSYIDRTNLIPFLVRFIRINNEIIFVSLSELPSTFLYYYTNKLLLIFNGLQYSDPKYFGFSALNQLENSIKKMQICLDFITSGNEKQSNRRNIQNAKLLKQKLDKFVKSDFKKYMLSVKNNQLSSCLEALTSAICLQLKELANIMIFSHHHNQLNAFRSITLNKLSKLKKLFLYQLRDYLTFIWVKSKRNIPIEPYNNLVSNLILFIYVDRNRNEFIWSFDQNYQDFNVDCSILNTKEMLESNCFFECKSKVNNLIDKSYQLLKTTQSMQNRWMEKNFIFNYAMWFEDHTGKLMNCNDKKFTLKSIPSLNKTNFIKEIVTQCFPSYKLVTNQNFNESIGSNSSSSSTSYSILKCYEIFYIQIKNSNQKMYSLDKVSNEEKFSCLSNLDLIQARRLGKKILNSIK